MPARKNNKRKPSSPALRHLYERFVEGDAEQEARTKSTWPTLKSLASSMTSARKRGSANES
ncbi:MAG: hypothetical protein IID37_15190 [Planctomycetes bacterium]|nr:hypothetical protein [Planctomycetota bacterium]